MKRLITMCVAAACSFGMMINSQARANLTEADIIVCTEAAKLARANVGVSGLMEVVARTNLTSKELRFLITCYDSEIDEILKELKK